MTGSQRGDTLIHPVALLALALLGLNDQVLKGIGPASVTGKLSDFAGLVVFPLLLVAIWERRPGGSLVSGQAVVTFVAGTGLAFGLVQIEPGVAALYEVVMGVARWPIDATVALLTPKDVAGPRPVRVWRDATDLIALPC